jgi:hypothetical protein
MYTNVAVFPVVSAPINVVHVPCELDGDTLNQKQKLMEVDVGALLVTSKQSVVGAAL